MAHRPKRLDGSYAMMIAGPGVAPGGLEGQFLRKLSDVDYDTYWVRVGFEMLAGIPSDNDALQEVLEQKSDISHTHDTRYYRQEQTYTQSEINALFTALDYSPSSHDHDDDYASLLLVPGTISGTAYEVVATDKYAAYLCTNAALTTVSLGNAPPVGSRVRFKSMGAGGFVYAAADGMTVLSAEDFLTTPQYGVSEAWRISETQWSILGHVEA